MGSTLTNPVQPQVYNPLGTIALTAGEQYVTAAGLNFTGYKGVFLRIVCSTATGNSLQMELNADSTAGNYLYEYVSGSTGTAAANNPAAATYIILGSCGTSPSSWNVWIDFTVGGFPHIKALGGKDTHVQTTVGNYIGTTGTGITQIKLGTAATTFSANSYMVIYGVI